MNIDKINTETEANKFSKQTEYMEKIKRYLSDFEQDTGRKQTYFVFTTGCQMNAHDSEKIAGMLEEMGFLRSLTEEDADFVIYNTCCIRENAEVKIYGRLGRLKHFKKTNKNMKIALCGCMTQQDVVIEKLRKSYKYVDIVFGTFNLYKLPELLYTNLETNETVFDIWKEEKGIVENIPTILEYPFKASVNISYGCDNFCSYCIVPYVRGRERSRKKEDILNEIKCLAASGIKEIVLLGQNVNSYGKNLNPPVSFAQLLREINELDGIERIRFMTSHPKDLSDELILAMKECSKVCNYLHLPFQAGSNAILEKMNRKYTKEKYLELINKIRSQIPDILLSTDKMVGFPGETEDDFLDTLDVVNTVGFSTAFTFIYSKRTGTPAAVMDNQIDEKTVKDRFNRLVDAVNKKIYEIHSGFVGKTLNILVEDVSKQDENIVSGRSENNCLVHFPGNKDIIGQTVPVKITGNKTFYLIGERI